MKIKKYDVILFKLLIFSLYLGRININIGFTLKPYMIITGIIFIYSIKEFNIRKLYSFERVMLLFIIVFSMTSLRFAYPEKHIRFVLAFCMIIFFYFTIRYFFDKFTIEMIEEFFVKTSNYALIFSIIYYIIGIISLKGNFRGNGISKYGVLLDRGIPRLTGLVSADPNIFVLFVTIIFVISFKELNKKRNKVALFLSGLCILLTFSRGAYIAIILALFIMIFMNNTFKNKIKIIILILFLWCMVIGIAKIFSIDLISLIFERFSSISNDGGSGRADLWRNAIITFKNNPILGIGINSTISYSMVNYGNSHYVHNSVLEVLSEGGIVTFFPFLIFLVNVGWDSIRLYLFNKKNKFILAIFLAMCVQMFTLSIIYNEMFYLFLLILQRYRRELKLKKI